jgi:hypothetical protein
MVLRKTSAAKARRQSARLRGRTKAAPFPIVPASSNFQTALRACRARSAAEWSADSHERYLSARHQMAGMGFDDQPHFPARL